jgi:hypothetical protein
MKHLLFFYLALTGSMTPFQESNSSKRILARESLPVNARLVQLTTSGTVKASNWQKFSPYPKILKTPNTRVEMIASVRPTRD